MDHTTERGTPDPSHEEGSVYDSLLGGDPAHWAFGTASYEQHSEDPLAGVDTTVPEGLDPAELAAFCLALGDDALVLSNRLSEWCSNAPDLADPSVVPVLPVGSPVPAEDALAFFREAHDFRNVRLVEIPNGDFGHTVARLLLFAAARLAAFERLASHADPVLAAIAAKGVKELAYHRDYAGRWFVTLAQGTEESRRRLLAGLADVWPLHHELLAAYDVGAEVDPVLDQVFAVAGVDPPEIGAMSGTGHTEALSLMLAEMQVVARAHPMGLW
jgi:ring-1,2-phenylacetyl-CoA epoxidase subunit PaaC